MGPINYPFVRPFFSFCFRPSAPIPVLYTRSPYAFSIEHRHTFLTLVIYTLAVAHLHILLKFPSFLDTSVNFICAVQFETSPQHSVRHNACFAMVCAL